MLDLTTVKTNVTDLMTRLDFPADAQAVLLAALDRIGTDKVAAAWLARLMAQYDESETCAYRQMLADIRAMGEALGLHEYTVSLLLFLCLGEKLRARYAERGIDEAVYYASMADLRYKLEECRLVHGEVGSFVASWFSGFFNLTRFALGRLQFEIIKTKQDYTVGGTRLPAGSKAINIHIPRTGTRLDHGEVLDAYRRAAEWFAPQLEGQPTVFTCSSWMLDPWNMTVLAPTSNMAAFYGDFEIVESGSYDSYSSVWRLFDCAYTGDPDALPGNSSLRRAYIERIRLGQPTGWGRGFFLWRDGEIVRA
ncbi:MAG: DUF5596 domain-containing protein [Clostridia bacterium]|nr:DUF5596 domain-containing protein [Clostridia bacterium]